MGKIVVPKVYKIAETKLNNEEISKWLKDLGGEKCLTHITGDDKEKLIEFSGRRCYKAYKKNLNPNVERIRTDSKTYHNNILESGHGSILEAATISFAIENVSRVCCMELIRHRAGAAYSMESGRYVRLTDLDLYFPKVFSKFGEDKEKLAMNLFLKTVYSLENVQKEFMEIFSEEMRGSFENKKLLTSAFRRLAPEGIATGIVCTYNFREIRHIISIRTEKHAEEEIRDVAGQIAELAIQSCPMIFGDFEKIDTNDGLFEYVPKYKKV